MPFDSGKESSARSSHPLWLLFGFWVCFVISIAVVLRRLSTLVRPAPSNRPPELVAMDATFASHAALTAAHIIPAAIFVILAAVLFFGRSDRWRVRLFFVFGAITGLTAYAMNAYAVGGWLERSAVLVFNTWFLWSLSRAYRFYLHGDAVRQREWMTRAVGVLLGIATTRPVMGVFFATSALTHLRPVEFFGAAFWVGFSINTIAIELWLHSRRRAKMQRRAALERSPQPA